MREFHESQYTKPRWTPERRATASIAARARMQSKIDEETSLIFDPAGRLSEVERIILVRIAGDDGQTARDIASRWPRIEETKAWKAFMALESNGYIKRNRAHENSMMQNRWQLTGCGQLVAVPQS